MWITESYYKSDLNDILNLTKENYGDIEISDKEFLLWQYEKNPVGDAVIKLVKDKEKNALAGQYVVIPMRFKIRNNIVKGTLSLNTLTKSEYRGQGIFTKLAKEVYKSCAENDLAFTYGFPNQNSYPGFIKKLSFKNIGNIHLLLRPLNIKKLVNKKINPIISVFIPNSKCFRKTKFNTIEDLIVYEINYSNLNDINQLWNDVKDNYKIIGVRDADYIKWRYLDIPLRKYKILAIKSKDKVMGYIIGTCKEVDGISSGMIVDFLIGSEDGLAGEILVNSIIKYFVDKNVDLVGTLMLPHTNEYNILRKNKFYICPKFLEPQPFPVIYRSHTYGGNNELMYDLKNWFLTMGDYDVI